MKQERLDIISGEINVAIYEHCSGRLTLLDFVTRIASFNAELSKPGTLAGLMDSATCQNYNTVTAVTLVIVE